MIGICTDSNAQLPAELIEQFDIAVVPLTVTVDGREYLEGVDLCADTFYAHYANGHRPKVCASVPSAGQFAAAYDELIERGCTEILSIHVGDLVSGALGAARLAVNSVPVPVKLIDSGCASFGLGSCVWAAANAIADGATLDQAAAVAEQLAPEIGNVFVVGALEPAHEPWLVPVFSLRNGSIEVVERCADPLSVVNAMAATAVGWGDRLCVAIGHSDAATEPLADALHEAIGETATVQQVVRYRVGPSVGAHTGPGTVGCFMTPLR